MSTLYIVATPIGNLEDISNRAIRILKEVDLIAAEDTRRTRKLLSYYKISTPITSYHEHGNKSKLPYILEHLEQSNIALVSEAGTPGLSDPGYNLIRESIKRNIKIVTIPGPSALPAALSLSGLPVDKFLYLGFLPRKHKERIQLLKSIDKVPWTIVIFEAPHRLLVSLNDVLNTLGDRQITVCRELTKIHEEVFRGSVKEGITHFAEPKGEFTLLILGYQKYHNIDIISDTIIKELRRLHTQGYTAKEAALQIAESTGLSKKTIYKAWTDTINQ